MKTMILTLKCLFILVMGFSAAGCAAKRVETAEVPKAPESNPASSTETVPQKYEVKKGDCLWTISGKPDIYDDSFQWPLIFKANRDQIEDPDEISPGQVFNIEKNLTPDEVRWARQMAYDTPKFKAHAKPRNPLPIDYF